MVPGNAWSVEEVEACVADYLQMLALELNGQSFSKAAHARTLLHKLAGRNLSSIEYKHRNVSAVMLELGYPYIRGYKPLANYQGLLLEAVEAQLQHNPDIQVASEAAVNRPAAKTAARADPSVWVSPPQPNRIGTQDQPIYQPRFSAVRRDYLAQEARNRSLGSAGELFVAELEAQRLHAAGKPKLANRVEHVARTQGDGLGYDVLSYEDSGQERLIEVKTTAFGEMTPFYVSRNELARSESDAERYHLYRLFDFREKPRVFDLVGAISQRCQLDPVSFLARPCT